MKYLISFLLLLCAISLAGCDTAKGRAEAEAINRESQVMAEATRQALNIDATAAANNATVMAETTETRISTSRTRWHVATIAFAVVVLAAAVALGTWGIGYASAQSLNAARQARTYTPDPATGAMPLIRFDFEPSKAARALHDLTPLIRLAKPGYQPPALEHSIALTDPDTGAQLQIRAVRDPNGRLHVWQQSELGPTGRQALAHHTRHVVMLASAMANMKQKDVAGEIAASIPAAGHIPIFEPVSDSRMVVAIESDSEPDQAEEGK